MSEKIISLRTTLTKKLKDLIKKFKSLTKTTNTDDISIEPIKKLSKIFDIPNDEEHYEDNPEEPPNEDSCSKINGWNDVSLAVCIIKSLDVLKKYMDSHIDNYIKTIDVARGIELFEGAYVLRSNIYKDWKSWNFLKNDYGIYYENTLDEDTLDEDPLANKIIKGDSRMNTTYNSIPEKLIYNFKLDNLISNYTSKVSFPPDVNNFLHTYDTNLGLLDKTSVFEQVQVTLSAGAGGGAQQPTIITKNVFTLINNNKRWIRLPCFTIFNQLSIFKGNADIAQEFTTLIKFGGIYQNNEIQSGIDDDPDYDPMILNAQSLENLLKRQIYPPENYFKFLPLNTETDEDMNEDGNKNYYGAYAYRYTDDTDSIINDNNINPYYDLGLNNEFKAKLGVVVNKDLLKTNFKYLSVSNQHYVPYDRYGNAPRSFVSGDRLSGYRYIMLGFLGIKYYLEVLKNTDSNENNKKLTNNINILSFGGFTDHLIDSTMSKFSKNILDDVYQSSYSDSPNEILQFLGFLNSTYNEYSEVVGIPQIPMLKYGNFNNDSQAAAAAAAEAEAEGAAEAGVEADTVDAATVATPAATPVAPDTTTETVSAMEEVKEVEAKEVVGPVEEKKRKKNDDEEEEENDPFKKKLAMDADGGKRRFTVKKIKKQKNKKTYKKKYNYILKSKIQKKIIQKRTKKKHSKNHKKTIKKNLKKKLRKTYKSRIIRLL